MKFMFVIRYGNLGGTERATLDLVRGLRDAGHQCELLFTAQIKGIGPILDSEHFPYVQLDRKASRFARYRRFRRLVREYRPDVFVQVGSRFITSLAAFGLPVRYKVYICHHHHKGEKSRFEWWANYAIVRRAFTSLMFVSQWLRTEAISFNSGIGGVSHVLYPPVTLKTVTTQEMQVSARRRLNLPPCAKLIGNAGRLMPVKRFDVFLRVAARIASVLPEAHFVIAGKGQEQQKLVGLADELGLSGRLTWLPWLTEMEDFYRSLDVLLFNTDMEAFGLMPCEAVAHGIPAVCSIISGGVSEIMPGQGKYCLNQHDEGKLAEAVVALCRHPQPEYVESFRAALRHHCESDRIVDRFLEIIEGEGVAL